ncbi:class I SAM-dependent methyltransferase [Rummeliibacillus sp. JY-2-4R]
MDLSATKKINLTEEKETLLITLYAKALDSRSQTSILRDFKAEEMVQMIDYDFEKLKNFGNDIMVVRAKQLDEWLSAFLIKHPDATILNLGCGLDTRIARINPPSSVHFFDVDFPEVIELRKSFFPKKTGYEMIPSSVNEMDWLNQIPKDKPTMIIIEGMLEYLTELEVKALLNRLTNYFPNGQIAFDVMNSFATNSSKKQLKETTGAIHKWTVDHMQEVDQLDSTLNRIATLSVFKSKYMKKLPLKTRILYNSLCLIPSFKNMMRLIMYRF